MSSRHQVDILRELKEKDGEQIIGEFAQLEAEKLRELMAYPKDTAGGLMIPEYLSFSSRMLVKDVLDDLQEQGEAYSDYAIQYAYVVSEGGELLGGVAFLWKGNPYLGLVVGVSLAANTLVAVSFGGMVPLILRRVGADPALASGPLLTTITDMCGFFFVLSFASALLSKISV